MDGLGPKTLALVLAGICLGSSLTHAQLADEPDLRKERKLFRIYEKYAKDPTPPEAWSEAEKKAADPSYLIQKGDTLWDISKTFFGDPNFWPKLWSLNPTIYNPHEILPKGQVLFKPGSVEAPPAMGMGPAPAPSQKEEEQPMGLAGGVPETKAPSESSKMMMDLDLSQIAIPPPAKAPSPLTPIPPSIPRVYSKALADRGKSQQIDVEIMERVIPEPQILVSHFASESKLEPIGEIVETESGSNAAAQDAMVFVKLENAQPGQRYLVVKSLGEVEARAADAKGYVNAVQAQIEIVNQINASEGVYRAKVLRSIALAEVGDDIIAEEIPLAPSSVEPAGGDVLSEVMGGQFNQRREIFGPGQILFLNAGTEAGVRVGTSLPIFRNPRARNRTSSYLLANPVQIGQIDIVRADSGTATALVRWANDEIRVGDVTSPGQIK